MTRFRKLSYGYSLLLILATACIEPYEPAVTSTDIRLLVVDAFLNTADGTGTVNLSRTVPLHADEKPAAELKATVTLEDGAGQIFTLSEKGNGAYSQSDLPIDITKKYRLHIRTGNSEEYFSDYIDIKTAPPIDSVYWVPESDGVQIYVDTHDATGRSHFYKWDYAETFEYTSAYSSSLKLVGGVVYPRYENESLYKCWRTDTSIDIFVGSSSKLQQDVISHYPIVFHKRGTRKLSRKYSILVKQYALTEEAYNYWLQLKQTTESLGSLFDPMPSEISGNIYNSSDPERPAIGFFSAGTITEKRIFISFSQLPSHLQRYDGYNCEIDTIPASDIRNRPNSTLLITEFGSPFPIGYLTSSSECIDCRFMGGTLTKPSFWE
jgi:hypothetical protein